MNRTAELTSTIELVYINENFSLGFCSNNQLAFFEDKEGLIQVEFDAKTQWTIDKSLDGYLDCDFDAFDKLSNTK